MSSRKLKEEVRRIGGFKDVKVVQGFLAVVEFNSLFYVLIMGIAAYFTAKSTEKAAFEQEVLWLLIGTMIFIVIQGIWSYTPTTGVQGERGTEQSGNVEFDNSEGPLDQAYAQQHTAVLPSTEELPEINNTSSQNDNADLEISFAPAEMLGALGAIMDENEPVGASGDRIPLEPLAGNKSGITVPKKVKIRTGDVNEEVQTRSPLMSLQRNWLSSRAPKSRSKKNTARASSDAVIHENPEITWAGFHPDRIPFLELRSLLVFVFLFTVFSGTVILGFCVFFIVLEAQNELPIQWYFPFGIGVCLLTFCFFIDFRMRLKSDKPLSKFIIYEGSFVLFFWIAELVVLGLHAQNAGTDGKNHNKISVKPTEACSDGVDFSAAGIIKPLMASPSFRRTICGLFQTTFILALATTFFGLCTICSLTYQSSKKQSERRVPRYGPGLLPMLVSASCGWASLGFGRVLTKGRDKLLSPPGSDVNLPLFGHHHRSTFYVIKHLIEALKIGRISAEGFAISFPTPHITPIDWDAFIDFEPLPPLLNFVQESPNMSKTLELDLELETQLGPKTYKRLIYIYSESDSFTKSTDLESTQL
ncbi:hypothetical protein G7Y89_g14492 [Cudoniella acicularis]|uniref:Uncharacterized protein n=1 Tax=Cudoniella acicularis TaxID=354080 RepID=A0A8H4R3M7_9HELO|nr:hypothetical protein G7Y89_g14492 [Cudoniella acicularis]